MIRRVSQLAIVVSRSSCWSCPSLRRVVMDPYQIHEDTLPQLLLELPFIEAA